MNELKTPVKRGLFLDNQRGKNGLPVQDLEYTEICRMIYRKILREARTRENYRYVES